jgi:hypothetical protein
MRLLGNRPANPSCSLKVEEIAARELAVLLEGIDLNKGKRRKRYSYKRLRELVNEWVDLEIARERAERDRERRAGGD